MHYQLENITKDVSCYLYVSLVWFTWDRLLHFQQHIYGSRLYILKLDNLN